MRLAQVSSIRVQSSSLHPCRSTWSARCRRWFAPWHERGPRRCMWVCGGMMRLGPATAAHMRSSCRVGAWSCGQRAVTALPVLFDRLWHELSLSWGGSAGTCRVGQVRVIESPYMVYATCTTSTTRSTSGSTESPNHLEVCDARLQFHHFHINQSESQVCQVPCHVAWSACDRACAQGWG